MLYQLCIKLCKRIDYLNSTRNEQVGGSIPLLGSTKNFIYLPELIKLFVFNLIYSILALGGTLWREDSLQS